MPTWGRVESVDPGLLHLHLFPELAGDGVVGGPEDCQCLAARKSVGVGLGFMGKLRPTCPPPEYEGDAAPLVQPVQHDTGAVSGVCDQPVRYETEDIVHLANPGLHRSDFGLTDRPGGLHAEEHTVICGDQVICGMDKKGLSAPSSRLLRCGIGMRREHRLHRARGFEGGVIDAFQSIP